MDTNLFLAAWPKSCCAKGDRGTWYTIWCWIVWDFNQLFHNKYADKDPWGNELPEHMQGRAGQSIMRDDFLVVVLGTCGDMEYFENELGCPHHACQPPKPCCLWCKGNPGAACHWFDFTAEAPWKTTEPHVLKNHPLWSIYGWTPWHFYVDWLHSVDLGAASHAMGNVIFDIAFGSLSYMSRAKAVQEIAQELLSHVPEHGSRLTTFELKHFCNPSRPHREYPVLMKLKAAHVRGMVPAVLALAQKYSDGSRHWRHQVRMMQKLASVYDTVHTAGIALTSEQFARMSTDANEFLLEYSFLSQEAAAAEKNLYAVMPKHHYFFHLVQQARFLNPRWSWCYGGEDLVGKASNLGHSCLDGTPGRLVAAKLMHKYRVAKHISWSRL